MSMFKIYVYNLKYKLKSPNSEISNIKDLFFLLINKLQDFTLIITSGTCRNSTETKRERATKKSTAFTLHVSITLACFVIYQDTVTSKFHKVMYNKYDNTRHNIPMSEKRKYTNYLVKF